MWFGGTSEGYSTGGYIEDSCADSFAILSSANSYGDSVGMPIYVVWVVLDFSM